MLNHAKIVPFRLTTQQVSARLAEIAEIGMPPDNLVRAVDDHPTNAVANEGRPLPWGDEIDRSLQSRSKGGVNPSSKRGIKRDPVVRTGPAISQTRGPIRVKGGCAGAGMGSRPGHVFERRERVVLRTLHRVNGED